ncbi:MAG: 50S ribosomal protein L4 [Candidatus Levybacteria bacterium]|nr:50S ribosomal protein L4 [Candidatus Levybacteria bacterium]
MPESKIKNQKSKIKNTIQNSKVKAVTKEAVKSVAKVAKKTTKVEAAMPVETKTANKKTGKSIKADVYDIKGKIVEKIDLPFEVFGSKVNKSLIAQAVRVYLANQRRGTVSTKTRGEVKGSTRKIYKQKGTGRARHGSIRAPIFVHGGIVFGPKPRDYSLGFSKKMKKAALFSALSAKLKDKEIKIITGLEKIQPKTKLMVEVVKNLELNNKNKKILLVLPEKNENINRAARNIEGLNMTMANQLNTYAVLNCRMLLLTKDSIKLMSKDLKRNV